MNNGHVEFFEKLNDPFGIKMGKRNYPENNNL